MSSVDSSLSSRPDWRLLVRITPMFGNVVFGDFDVSISFFNNKYAITLFDRNMKTVYTVNLVTVKS